MTHSYTTWTLRERGKCGFAAGLILTLAFGAMASTPRLIISGYVVDRRGVPVAAATVMAIHLAAGPPWGSSAADTSPQIISATRSNEEGHFEFYLRRSDCSRVNCLFFDHHGKSGVALAIHHPDPMRLVMR